MRIDIIAEKNSTKLSVIKIKLETLWTKIKNQEINYIVSELINYIENSLAKIEIDEAISIDDNNDTNNGDIDFTISWLKQNQNNSWSWTFELKQTQQWIFTIKCEVNKYQDIVESNKDNNSIMW